MSDLTTETPKWSCEFCHKNFSSKGNLSTHLKTTKFCLKLQGVDNTLFQCADCGKNLATSHSLQYHHGCCRVRQRRERDELQKQVEDQKVEIAQQKLSLMEQQLHNHQQQIDKLQDSVISMASRPTFVSSVTTNKTTNNMNILNLTDTDRIRSLLCNELSAEMIGNGQRGIAQFAVQHILTDSNGNLLYKCVDPARQNFVFINENGHSERDVKAFKLGNALSKSDLKTIVFRKGDDLWMIDGKVDSDRMHFFQDKLLEIGQMESDASKFTAEMVKLTT